MIWVLAGVLVLLNVVAWNQAAGMTVLRPYVRKLTGLPGFLRMAFCGMRVLRPAITETPAHHHLPFTEHAFPSGDGMPLHGWLVPAQASAADSSVEAEPARALVITFNWFGAAKCALLPHIREFHQAGLDVLAVDLRGHGASGGMETTLGWREGGDVLAAISYARRVLKPERILLHGVSLGAAGILRAFYLADLNPDSQTRGQIAGLILEAPFDRLYHTVRHRVATFGVPEWLPLAALMLFWGGMRQGFPPFGHNPADFARCVTVPTLVMHGAADPYIREAEARRIADAVAEGKGEFCLIDGHPHGTSLLDLPGKWREAVMSFVQKCLRG